MNAADYDAVVVDGEIYCLDCFEGDVEAEYVSPVFVDEEWQFPGPCCSGCGKRLDYMDLIIDRQSLMASYPVLKGYVECAVWAETFENEDGDTVPLDSEYGPEDLTDEAVKSAWERTESFLSELRKLDETVLERIDHRGLEGVGHDLWLTQRGHGTGFWDRGYAPADVATFKQAIKNTTSHETIYPTGSMKQLEFD